MKRWTHRDALLKRWRRRTGQAPTDKMGRGRITAMQLKRGCKVELEHTRSWRRACAIALDHLTEDPRYYVKLAKIHLD